MAVRRFFQSPSLRLSYVDFGGSDVNERILLALHGHFGCGKMFANLAKHLEGWRVVALDQRGHGWSGHAQDLDYSRESYVRDVYAMIQSELGGRIVVLLGHSLGGVNAYQFAANYPALVKGMIIEDIGAKVDADSFAATRLPRRVETLAQLKEAAESVFGMGSFPYFAESAVEDEEGWGFRFHREGIEHSQKLLSGDWWDDWLSSDCPVLLIHGNKSWAVDTAQVREMAARRPNTRLTEFSQCGHTVHDDDAEGFNLSVKGFLNQISAFN